MANLGTQRKRQGTENLLSILLFIFRGLVQFFCLLVGLTRDFNLESVDDFPGVPDPQELEAQYLCVL